VDPAAVEQVLEQLARLYDHLAPASVCWPSTRAAPAATIMAAVLRTQPTRPGSLADPASISR